MRRISRSAVLYATKRSVVFDRARRSAKKSWLKLDDHKGFFWSFVFAADPKVGRGRETEARVIFGMSEDNDGAKTKLFAPLKAGAHERRADAPALMLRSNGHRSKTQDF